MIKLESIIDKKRLNNWWNLKVLQLLAPLFSRLFMAFGAIKNRQTWYNEHCFSLLNLFFGVIFKLFIWVTKLDLTLSMIQHLAQVQYLK